MVNAEEFYKRIIEVSGYSDTELKGLSRKREIGDKRAVVSCIMRDNGYTLHEIGKVLGRSHGTVWTSYLSAREYVEKKIEEIKNKL
jgi:chromosomal replication initiation ATPase DnaA